MLHINIGKSSFPERGSRQNLGEQTKTWWKFSRIIVLYARCGTKWKVVRFSTIAWVRHGDQPATSSNGLFCLPQNSSELVNDFNGVCEVLEFPRNIIWNSGLCKSAILGNPHSNIYTVVEAMFFFAYVKFRPTFIPLQQSPGIQAVNEKGSAFTGPGPSPAVKMPLSGR